MFQEASSMSTMPFANKVLLSKDMTCHILCFLDNYEMRRMASVCKDWNAFLANPACWHILGLSDRVPEEKQCELLLQLVLMLKDKNLLAQVKLVCASLTMRDAEVYQLLLANCPLFSCYDPRHEMQTPRFGVNAYLINKFGAPPGKTLAVTLKKVIEGHHNTLERPLPAGLCRLFISCFTEAVVIPKTLKSLTTFYRDNFRELECLPTLQELTLICNTTLFANPLADLELMPELLILALKLTTTPRELAKFAKACQNIESLTIRVDVQRFSLAEYTEQLKHWQLKTLTIAIEGAEHDDHDSTVAWIRQELPSLEHIRLCDERRVL
jgi:hypothetical protein